MYPLGLALLTHLAMLTPFKDIDMASPMLQRGKLSPFPRKSRGVKELREVMARIEELEKEQGMPVQERADKEGKNEEADLDGTVR